MKYQKKFIEIIKSDKRLMKILKAARKIDLPDWYVGAGVIRRSVWDYLHGRIKQKDKSSFEDIDLLYFSKEKLNENELIKKLVKDCPEYK
jgi:uncharacterized protein